MKRFVFLLLQILLSYTINAQHFVSKKWDARFGGTDEDEMYAICKTSDGSMIAGGTTLSGVNGNVTQPSWGSYDYWIVKFDATGNYLWDKRFGGSGDDAFTTIIATRDGGCILGGFSSSNSGGDKTQNSQGGFDYWVVKVDSLGNKQWDRRFGGSNDDILDKVIQTKDGGYALAGFSSSDSSGDKTQNDWDPTERTADYWVVKIDSIGNKQWDRRFGGTDDDLGRDVIQTPDGGYLIGGSSASDSSGDKTQPDYASSIDNYWIIKIDSLGNKQWNRVYGGVLGEYFNNSLNIPSGGYLLGGTSYDGASGNKTSDSCGYWLVKIDTAGNKLGDWVYGSGLGTGSGMCAELFGSMINTLDRGYLLTGTSGDVWTIKIDSQMNRVWDKTALTTGSFDKSAGALESNNSCYVIGVVTSAGIGGDKTQPNWDTTNATDDYWIVEYCDSFPLGIQQSEGAMHLLVYPNPTSGDLYINIQKDNLTEASFTLTSTTGQVIYQNTADHLAHSYTKILDLSGLPTGVYMLSVTVDGERIVKKVLKE